MQVLQQLAILSPSQNGVGVERFFNRQALVVVEGLGLRSLADKLSFNGLSRIFDEIVRTDIRNAFFHSLSYCRLRHTGFERFQAELWPNNFHKIVQNRLALLGEESVSVVTDGTRCQVKLGDPTHAYLYHWQ